MLFIIFSEKWQILFFLKKKKFAFPIAVLIWGSL